MGEVPATRLLYYDDAYLRKFAAKILQIIGRDGSGDVILDRTAFYPTGGGQPSDRIVIEAGNGTAEITDVQWNRGRIRHVSIGVTSGIRRGDVVEGTVDWNRRYSLMRNHTAAHIMAVAIRQAVGSPVAIVSSGLEVHKARLDLAFDRSLRPLLPRIESIVDGIVRENRPVEVKRMDRGAAERYVARFYESLKTLPSTVSQVRIVEVPGVHACACGGTHVKTTGEIGAIEILGRSSKGKGVERLEFRAQSP